jgi:hypothetical protein
MQARIAISVECPSCQTTMYRLPKHYYVQCLMPDCDQFQVLYELPLLDLKPVGDIAELDESTLIEAQIE